MLGEESPRTFSDQSPVDGEAGDGDRRSASEELFNEEACGYFHRTLPLSVRVMVEIVGLLWTCRRARSGITFRGLDLGCPEHALKSPDAHTEDVGGGGLVALCLREHPLDVLLFNLLESRPQ